MLPYRSVSHTEVIQIWTSLEHTVIHAFLLSDLETFIVTLCNEKQASGPVNRGWWSPCLHSSACVEWRMTHVTIWFISPAHRLCSPPHCTRKKKCIFSFNKRFTHRTPVHSQRSSLWGCRWTRLGWRSSSCLRSKFHEVEIIWLHVTFGEQFSFPHIHDCVVSLGLTLKFKHGTVICQTFEGQDLKTAQWTLWLGAHDLWMPFLVWGQISAS